MFVWVGSSQAAVHTANCGGCAGCGTSSDLRPLVVIKSAVLLCIAAYSAKVRLVYCNHTVDARCGLPTACLLRVHDTCKVQPTLHCGSLQLLWGHPQALSRVLSLRSGSSPAHMTWEVQPGCTRLLWPGGLASWQGGSDPPLSICPAACCRWCRCMVCSNCPRGGCYGPWFETLWQAVHRVAYRRGECLCWSMPKTVVRCHGRQLGSWEVHPAWPMLGRVWFLYASAVRRDAPYACVLLSGTHCFLWCSVTVYGGCVLYHQAHLRVSV